MNNSRGKEGSQWQVGAKHTPGNYPGQKARRLGIYTPHHSFTGPRLPPGNWACNAHCGLWRPKNHPRTKMQVLAMDCGAGMDGNHKGIWGNRHQERGMSVQVSDVKKLAQGHTATMWQNWDLNPGNLVPINSTLNYLPYLAGHIKCSSVVAVIVIMIIALWSHMWRLNSRAGRQVIHFPLCCIRKMEFGNWGSLVQVPALPSPARQTISPPQLWFSHL